MAPTSKRARKSNSDEMKEISADLDQKKGGSNDTEVLCRVLGSQDDNCESEDDNANDMGNIMSMIQTAFVQKNSTSKRKRSEMFLNASVKVSAKKMEEIVQRQGGERRKLQEQYQLQIETLMNSWDGEIEKCKEMEEKLANTFRQQQKFYTTLRVNQTKILNDLKSLSKQYNSASEDLDKLHSGQQGDIQGDLKREVSMLHKKYLMETHNSEVAKMKQNIQQLLTATL